MWNLERDLCISGFTEVHKPGRAFPPIWLKVDRIYCPMISESTQTNQSLSDFTSLDHPLWVVKVSHFKATKPHWNSGKQFQMSCLPSLALLSDPLFEIRRRSEQISNDGVNNVHMSWGREWSLICEHYCVGISKLSAKRSSSSVCFYVLDVRKCAAVANFARAHARTNAWRERAA